MVQDVFDAMGIISMSLPAQQWIDKTSKPDHTTNIAAAPEGSGAGPRKAGVTQHVWAKPKVGRLTESRQIGTESSCICVKGFCSWWIPGKFCDEDINHNMEKGTQN